MRRVHVDELEGGIRRPPIPPGFEPPTQGLPLVQTRETSDGPWRNAGTYGRQQSFAFPASVNADPIAVFSVDQQLGPPRPRTLHLFRSDGTLDTDFPVIDNAEIYARITYGVSGITNQFLCDWTRGGQLALVCDSLRLEAIAYAPSTLAVYSPPTGTQLIGAMLGETGAVPILPPTFTTSLVNLPASSDVAIVVPDFARKVYPVFTNVPIPANVALLFYTLGEQVALGQFSLDQTTAIQGLVLPGGTSIVRVVNTSAGSVTFCLVFQLGL